MTKLPFTTIRATACSDPLTYHGEGPVWDSRGQRLLLVDLLAGEVVSYNGQESSRYRVGTYAAAIRPRRTGGWVLGVDRVFALADDNLGNLQILPSLWEDPDLRMNDGGCDPYGNFLCGSTSISGRLHSSALFRLEANRNTSLVHNRVSVSNGLGWSPDGAVAYFIDTPTQRVDRYAYDPETGFSNGRPLAVIDPAVGAPDGLCVDAQGGVWVALWAGSAVLRYDSKGRQTHRVELPVTNATACTFGGPDLGTLFVTTSRVGLQPEEEPAAGSIFEAHTPFVGLPSLTYAG